jgi:hypothetical protein
MSERYPWWKLLLIALVGLLGYLFWAQNRLQVVSLTLNLGFAAWKLQEGWPVPSLLGIAFLCGLVPTLLWSWFQRARLENQVRKLQQELAIQSAPSKNSWQ